MRTDEIAVLTMVHGEAFLAKWIAHHAALFGRENLFILSHGADPRHDSLCEGTNHITLPRRFDETFEPSRIALINNMANGLLQVYRRVVFLDVDELLTLAPSVDGTLADYLRGQDARVLAPLGLELMPEAPGFVPDWQAPLLEQVPRAIFTPAFCKPCIRSVRVAQGPGGHRVNTRFRVDPNLLLFHLKYVDASLEGRYDGLVAEMASFETRPKGMIHWPRFRRGRPGPVERTGWQDMTPAQASEGRRGIEEVKPGWFRCDRTRHGVALTLPKAYRRLA